MKFGVKIGFKRHKKVRRNEKEKIHDFSKKYKF